MKIAIKSLTYLLHTHELGITFNRFSEGKPILIGWSDSAFKDDVKTGRSTAGYSIGFKGSGPMITKTRLTKTVSLSSCEAELKALTDCVRKVMWFRHIMEEMKLPMLTATDIIRPTLIMEDNQSAIAIAKNPITTERSEHIDVREFYCREMAQTDQIRIQYIQTNKMIADMLTKPLPLDKVRIFRKAIMDGSDVIIKETTKPAYTKKKQKQ